MPLFSASHRPQSDNGTHADDEPWPESSSRQKIGDLLRETRASQNGQLERIAGVLRIRASYLSAIEDSRYDRLPSAVYARGFIRAYAVYLGLDGDEAVRRFKQETVGLDVERDLSFPVPLAARSIPGGTMVLAAVILAICGYGLWYYVSTGDRARPERVSAVPAGLAPSPPAAPAAGTPTATSPVRPAPAANAAAPAAASPAPALPPSTARGTAAPGATPTALPAAGAVAATPAPAVARPAPAMAAAPAATPVPAAADRAQSAAAPASANPAPPASAPRVFGVVGGPARIVIYATKDSWIQIRNGDQTLIERILHPGDSVRVPDEAGLTMRTGNGAGLEIQVDGKNAPALGGTVRTLVLDPDRLMSGTARTD